MVSLLMIRNANVNGVYTLGSWEATPAFKSSNPSRLLVGGGHLASLSSLAQNKVKSREVRPLLTSSLAPGRPLCSWWRYQPCFVRVEAAILASGPWASHVGFPSLCYFQIQHLNWTVLRFLF